MVASFHLGHNHNVDPDAYGIARGRLTLTTVVATVRPTTRAARLRDRREEDHVESRTLVRVI